MVDFLKELILCVRCLEGEDCCWLTVDLKLGYFGGDRVVFWCSCEYADVL
jgi:hypothetical protein